MSFLFILRFGFYNTYSWRLFSFPAYLSSPIFLNSSLIRFLPEGDIRIFHRFNILPSFSFASSANENFSRRLIPVILEYYFAFSIVLVVFPSVGGICGHIS
eukprot:TRINITY_DN1927_c0_g1_i1.p1 TRINITY_DN1927_c0_g1~~TRINITY_DN1927_c0_g1_i1.p1  ORF type:complete len:101 (+),score=0.81 TRINITY_DN1927_c0_g1_i1:380-682(+)